MTDTIEVGQRYRNSTGEYEILSIDGMWATVRYDDGQTKRHLLAALQIHWENDRAEAEAGVAAHLRRFWDPSMRRRIKAHLEEGGAGLSEIARAGVARLDPPAS